MDISGFSDGGANSNSQNSLNDNNESSNSTNNFNSQIPPQAAGQPPPIPFPSQISFPPNFDLNSLPPAERELLLRRLQQQQQQLQRARQQQFQQAQAQAQAQRMTMNSYSTPRPPLGNIPPGTPMMMGANQIFVNPMNPVMMGYPQMSRPVNMNPAGINPALLQQSQAQAQAQGMKQINPQQFTNPLASAVLKSDPVLYTVSQTQNPAQSQSLALNLPPFDDQVLSCEANFIEHLVKFLEAIKFPNRPVPQIANRPVSLYRLFTVVTSLGGFLKVGETKKWPIVTHSLQLPAQSYEIVSMVRTTYYSFLYAYEQYFVHKKPLDKIDCKSKVNVSVCVYNNLYLFYIYLLIGPNQPKVPQPSTVPVIPANNTASNLNAPPKQTNQPQPVQSQSAQPVQSPAPQAAQILKFIPETDLSLWKPFADVMKIPVYPILDIDTAILYMNSPYFILKVEALLTTQRLFAQLAPKDLQAAGLSADSLTSLLDILASLWSESSLSLPKRFNNPNKTMEQFWAEVDAEKRELLEAYENDLSFDKRDLMICRLISNLLRTICVTKGSEVNQLISRSSFIKSNFLSFSLIECDDLEIYKDALIIFESLSPHLGDVNFLSWEFKQCQLELNQCRTERLLGLVTKFTGILSLDRIGYFDNLMTARQTVSALITQCAQLWKNVPAHIFIHLSTCLSLLTSMDDCTPEIDLRSFVTEIEKFMNIFVLPIVSLLRSVRALYEYTNSFSNSQDEVRRVLETVIYSSNFSLTDGGFMEISLQILSKCRDCHVECMDDFDWTGVMLLLRELREYWRHSNPEGISNLSKACYQPNIMGSPAKKFTSANYSKLTLSILNGSSNIPAIFSHPFLVLCKSLHLLAVSFPSLPPSIQLDLLELTVEWNLETPSKWGREVLGAEKIEESLKILREFYFK